MDTRPAAVPPFLWKTVVRHGAVPLAKLAGFRAFEDEYEAQPGAASAME